MNAGPVIDMKLPLNVPEWLEAEVEINGEKMPRHQRISWLILANGGVQVTGWIEEPVVIDGHQRGLTVNEAIELIQAVAFMGGLDAAGLACSEVMSEHLLLYVSKFTLPEVKSPAEAELEIKAED